MRKVMASRKHGTIVRPRRVVLKIRLTPQQEAKEAELTEELEAFDASPEGRARMRFYREEGCFPEMKAYRDDLMAKGYDKPLANVATQELRARFYNKPGRTPAMHTFYDNLIAQGHAKKAVNVMAQTERLRLYLEDGCVPELKEFRDNLIAQGQTKRIADAMTKSKWLRSSPPLPNPQPDPYTDVDDLPQPRIKHIRRQRPQHVVRRITSKEA